MRLIIEERDFRRLSAATRSELIATLSGKRNAGASTKRQTASPQLGRRPVDIDAELAAKLLHGLAENHRRRLQLFARRDGRVTMRQLLAVTKDTDLRVLSYFEGAVTRKLRRLLRDTEKKTYLIGWDYDETKWDKAHKRIINGVLYVSDATARALKDYFGRS
ncbi:MAG: hypothetical protein ACE5H8_11670 [Alphaproteobacteria bacterium]